MPKPIVAIEGPSAAGKTEVAQLLAVTPGSFLISEAFTSIQPRASLRFRSDQQLLRLELRLIAEESRRYLLAQEMASQGRRVILDTGFLGPLTYTGGLVRLGLAKLTTFGTLLTRFRSLEGAGVWGLPDFTVYLDVPRSERDRRADSDPGRHPPRLYLRHAEVAREELKMYRLKIASILGRNLAFVNGVGTPQKVASGIQHAIRLFGNQSLDSDAGIRVVDSLERHLKADPREIFLSPI